MDIVNRKYFIETKPIETEQEASGGRTTRLMDLSLRVVDGHTRMPVGSVIHAVDGKGGMAYKAVCAFAPDGQIKTPAEGWQGRFDLAADAVWSAYSRGLPRHERVKRWAWRWLGVGWFLFGTVWGVLTSLIARAVVPG